MDKSFDKHCGAVFDRHDAAEQAIRGPHEMGEHGGKVSVHAAGPAADTTR